MANLTQLLSSRRFIQLGIVQLGLFLAGVLGLGVAQFGLPVIGLLLAPLAGLVLYVNSLLGLYTVTLTLPIEELIPGVSGATGTRLLGMVVFGVWLVRKVLKRESWLPVMTSPLLQVSVLLLLWILASLFWAEFTDQTIAGLFTMVQLVLFSLIVIDLVNSWERVTWIARILVIAGLIAALATLEQYFIAGVKRAGDGVAGGVNFTASMMVSIMPFAFYLLRAPQPRGVWKLFGLLFIGLGAAAIAVTFSRSSYIFFMLVIALNSLEALRSGSGRGWIMVLTAITIVVILLSPREAIASRVQTIAPGLENWIRTLNGDSQLADVRGYHWRVGMAMFRDSPLYGVGYNNFGTLFLAYQLDVPGAPEFFSTPRSPHSSYVGILSELGLIGIGIWLAILFIAMRNLVKAWDLLRKGQDEAKLLLVQAISMIFLVQVLYAWVLNAHMNKIMWFILGLSVVVRRLALSQNGPLETSNPRLRS